MLRVDLRNKKALLIDCDGTLADTMPAHNKAYEIAFSVNGVPFDMEEHEKWAPYGGKVLMQQTVINKGFGDKVDNIIVDKQRFLGPCLEKFMKPNKDLIDFIKNRPVDIKAYVVTNGRKQSIMKILNALGIAYVIDGLITPEILGTVKPSPEPYNYAMVVASMDCGTHVGPEDVVVFEDNEVGVTAAQRAGIEPKDIVVVDPNEF